MIDWCNKAVSELIKDICDRRGLRQAYESIDKDTQREIKQTWARIIRKHAEQEQEKQ